MSLHSTLFYSLAHKLWCHQPITSNGNKRSVLNYSFMMSNNACRLLFRVGETHWIIQGWDSLSLEKQHSGSDVWESYLHGGALCHSWTDLGRWCSSNMGGTEGGRDSCSSISARLLHTGRVSRKDYRELAAPCLSSPSVCLQYIVCHAALGGCQCIKKGDYSFTMTCSDFHPRYVSVLVH